MYEGIEHDILMLGCPQKVSYAWIWALQRGTYDTCTYVIYPKVNHKVDGEIRLISLIIIDPPPPSRQRESFKKCIFT